MVGLVVLASIVSLLLGVINQQNRLLKEHLRQEEVLNIAIMAVQTKQDNISLNGVSVAIQRDETSLQVLHEGKQLIEIRKN